MTDSSFSAAMWADAADVRHGIEQHRFVRGLLQGTLPRPAFEYYLEQDAHYLTGYAAALRACATQAERSESRSFWADTARETVDIERLLHEDRLHGRPLPERSANCSAYLSFLLDSAAAGDPAVLAAAVLPCFWIFSDLGRRCAAVDLGGHPYADWVGTYRDPRFATATATARAVVDDLAERGGPTVRAAMRDAFGSACRYERLLFDDAWAGGAVKETPTPLPGGG